MFFQPWFDRYFEKGPGEQLAFDLARGRSAWLSGVWGSARAFVAASLISRLRQSAVFVAQDEASALELHEELRFFLQGFPSLSGAGVEGEFKVKYPLLSDPGRDPLVFFPAIEISTLDPVNREHGRNVERLLVLRRLARSEPLIIVTTLEAICQRQVAPEALLGAELNLEKGRDYVIDELVSTLVNLGYRRETQVEDPGQFAWRGGILDIAPPNLDQPVRLEFFGDTLESLRHFDPATQTSKAALQHRDLDRLEVMPFHEILLDAGLREQGLVRVDKAALTKAQRLRWHEQLAGQSHFGGMDWLLPFFFPENSFFDYLACLKAPPLLFLDNPQQVHDRLGEARQLVERVRESRSELGLLYPGPDELLLSEHQFFLELKKRAWVGMSLLPHSLPELPEAKPLAQTFKALNLTPGDAAMLSTELVVWLGRDWQVLLAAPTHGDLTRLKAKLEERRFQALELDSSAPIRLDPEALGLTLGHLEKGWVSPELGLCLVSDQEASRRSTLSGPAVYRHRFKGLKGARKIESFAELKAGQYAVHVDHGIGLFLGIVRMNIEGFDKDFVSLQYADKEKLYIPVDQVDKVQKYLGGEEHPRLHKLGSGSWEATREKVKKAVAEMAEELLKLYATRQLAQVTGLGPDSAWQRTFEESFPFQETEDQLKAIEEIKKDLEGRKPMDRLLCGDVGFGKTEVALRAVFKAVTSGNQAAVLVPTTILASQHFETFEERLRGFPIKVAQLSRFRTPKEQRETVEGLRSGAIDLVVGTHRLLSKDIAFKKLGLLVIDEEQRFGVAHKERLKKLRTQVSVLTMSATPVPRTLHFSLAGLRDMSMIETPPLNRLPVRTYVLEDDQGIMRESIVSELARGGQVFFVHNRVKDIEKVAGRLRELVPEAHVVVAHGQMPKDRLEKVMHEFMARAHDILVATTIIESGLDIPNVNTIIINHSHDFGLSQLYQLRGRVGRAQRQAYAYLFYPKGRSIPEVAEKRLAAIEEFTDLGSGFKVAMRDLEIRGVGNILGPQQHGNVAAVGFDLYCHLLNDAMAKLKGEDIPVDRTPTLHLDMDAYIPETYISDARQKMDWYKRLAQATEMDALKELGAELVDRYGEPPHPVKSLLDAVEVRVWALRLGLSEVTQKGSQIVLRYFEDTVPGEALVKAMMAQWKDKVRFLPGPPPGLLISTVAGQGRSTLRALLPALQRHSPVKP